MNASNSLQALDRRAAVARILADRGDGLVVASLGNPSFDVAAAGDLPTNFYLWGAMGGAVMCAMGLALAQPRRRVVVFAGDGEMMMGIGAFATAATHGVPNLGIVVLDNEHYAETGMQAAHSGRGVDIAAIARGSGVREARLVRSQAELADASRMVWHAEGPVLATVKVSTAPAPASLPPRDGPYLRSRFREALLGADAHA